MDPKFEQALVSAIDRLKQQKPALNVRGLSADQLRALSVRDLKDGMKAANISFAGLLEKEDLVQKILSG